MVISEQQNESYAFNSSYFLEAFIPAVIQTNLSTMRLSKGVDPRHLVFSDSEIVAMWIETSSNTPDTRRCKRKEGERLIFYSWFVLHKHLNELDSSDLDKYVKFIGDPKPTDNWISKTKWPRLDSRWRPFASPLKPRSRKLAVIIIGNLFKWMINMRLIQKSPTSEASPSEEISPYLDIHVLPENGISCIYRVIDADINHRKRYRNRFMFTLFCMTGITPLEAVSADMNSIRQATGEIAISRKNRKDRVIPFTKELVDDFILYRKAFSLQENIQQQENLPLLLTSNSKYKRLSRSTVTHCMSAIMKKAAEVAKLEKANHLADLLSHASAYWLRHTHLQNLAESGAELLSTNRIAGHSSLETTKKYYEIE